MTPKKIKHRDVTPAEVRTRLNAATKFLDAATMYIEDADAASWQVAGANAVSAGIAASDAVCGHALGYYAQGDNHADALELLTAATSPDREPRKHLAALLDEKSGYQYGTLAVRQQAARLLVQHAERLVTSARDRVGR
jgi:hypothetical protein